MTLGIFHARAGRIGGMEEKREKRSGGGALIFAAIGLMALLVFYVLSFGPAVGLHWRGYLPAEVLWIYAPLRWAAKSCEPFGDFITWYKNLFREAKGLPNF